MVVRKLVPPEYVPLKHHKNRQRLPSFEAPYSVRGRISNPAVMGSLLTVEICGCVYSWLYRITTLQGGYPTSYNWSYGAPYINGLINGCSWGYFTLLIGIITPFITSRGTPCNYDTTEVIQLGNCTAPKLVPPLDLHATIPPQCRGSIKIHHP